jgi:hypothetical protein
MQPPLTYWAVSKAVGNTELSVAGAQGREDGERVYSLKLTFGWCFKHNEIAHWPWMHLR